MYLKSIFIVLLGFSEGKIKKLIDKSGKFEADKFTVS
jgi:hypothetical protein